MKKPIYIFLWLCFFVCGNTYSQVVSQETAQHVAENFFNETIKNDSQKAASAYLWETERTITGVLLNNTYYIL